MTRHAQTGTKIRFAKHKQQLAASLLIILLLVSQFSYLAPEIHAASTNAEPNLFQRFIEKLFPPTISPIPESKKPSVPAEDESAVTPKVQPLDLTDMDIRITQLENQLASSGQISVHTSFSTGTNLIRNSSFESADGGIPRQWHYIYDSTTGNTAQTEEGIRSGHYGVKFEGTRGAGNGLDLGISQPETETVPGRTYTLSVYIKHTNVEGETFVRLGFWDKYNNRFAPMKTVPITGTRDWHRLSTTVETTGNITDYANWYPMIEVRRLRDGAAVYVDDVQLEEGAVLTLYNSAQATTGSFGGALGNGSVLGTATGTLYPAEDGIGSLGTTSNRFRELHLSKASINESGNLSLEGGASVGNLTVNGTSTLKGHLTLGDSTDDTITIAGTPTFSALSSFKGGITVGENGEFAINSSGDLSKIRGVAYSFPSAQGAANEILINDGSGNLSWGTFGAASVSADSLDFAQFADAMTVDADTSINLYNGGATNLSFHNANSGSELLFLDSSTGRVGIGTITPGYKLEVNGNALAGGILLASNGIGLAADPDLLSLASDALTINGTLIVGTLAGGATDTVLTHDNGTLQSRTIDSRVWGSSLLDFSGTNTNYIPYFVDSNTLAASAIYQSGGNIGIGTTTPATTLHLNRTPGTNLEIFRIGQNGSPRLTITDSGFIDSSNSIRGSSIFANSSYNGGNAGDSVRFFNSSNSISPSGNMALAGNITINGIGSNYFANSVGIGTTGPIGKLHVSGSNAYFDTSNLVIRDTTGGSTYVQLGFNSIFSSSGNVGIGAQSPAAKLDVNGTAWLRGNGTGLFVNSSGNVSIGTTAPLGKLHVSGGDIFLDNGKGIRILTSEGFQTTAIARDSSNRLQFYSNSFAFNDGNVGIGTTSPSTKLHIADNDSSAIPQIQIDQVGSGDAAINFTRPGVGGWAVGLDQSDGDKLKFSRNYVDVGSLTRMTLDVNGNLGIGTTNPQYKLDVNGDINTTGDIRKNGTAYTNPDYVFEPDYGIMSLDALKTYVATNKHLPGVPSSADILRDGVKLFEQTRLNLEKTEEAYLYLFDLDNRLSALSLPQQPPATTTLAVAGDTNLDIAALQEELEAVKDQQLTLEERLELFQKDDDEQVASLSATLAAVKADVEFLKSTQSIASVSALLANKDIPIKDGDETELADLIVTGKANIYDLAVLRSITTGLLTIEGLSCTDEENCKASISTLNGPLSIQETATGPLEIMAGKVAIDTNGDMKIDGKLTVGEVEVEKVKTQSVDLGKDVTMTAGDTLPQNPCTTGTMYVYNDKKSDEVRIYVCSKKSWQELKPVQTQQLPTASPTTPNASPATITPSASERTPTPTAIPDT